MDSRTSYRGEMTYVSAKPVEIPSRRGSTLSGVLGSLFAATALASIAAAWNAGLDPMALVQPPTSSSKDHSRPSFADRFSASVEGIPPHSLDQSVLRDLEIKIREAKVRLAEKMQSLGLRTATVDQTTPPVVTTVPLPRSRPVEAIAELHPAQPVTQPDTRADTRTDNRTLLQKFSDLLPGSLASLGPDVFNDGPDLGALGYDNVTAVYDISTHVVYMPNGSKLEAHSGFGNLMDDPGHVNERNIGATPPNVYDLKPRERLFHGVQALRMIPADEKGMLGRSGLLAHSYMLGPNGDSNGCVSFKNYDKFLKAFQNGEVKRLVVVTSLGDVTASRRASSI
jgi:Protein of unknown function (DUF2778)